MNSFDSGIENASRLESLTELPDKKGFCIICIKDKNNLPERMIDLEYNVYRDYPVLYIGTTTSLKKRRLFNGTGRNSTLRKSLGSILELEREYYRDGKYKFVKKDEEHLSKWINDNLIMFYSTNVESLVDIESYLINKYNPPLNLRKNYNDKNILFREYLTDLRTKK